MNTPYSKVWNRFLNKLNGDTVFFKKDINEQNARLMGEVKMLFYMDEAIREIMTCGKYDCPIDLTKKDDALKEFSNELTSIEETLISETMFVKYIDDTTLGFMRALGKLFFSDSEIKVFSPAEDMRSFESSFKRMQSSNYEDIIDYKLRNRETHKRKTPKFGYNGV